MQPNWFLSTQAGGDACAPSTKMLIKPRALALEDFDPLRGFKKQLLHSFYRRVVPTGFQRFRFNFFARFD